jgi:tetratricopeptide (TPR) repeat protein
MIPTRYVYLVLYLLATAFLTRAASFSSISGELSSDQAYDFSSLEVELQELSNQIHPAERAHVFADGRFELRNVSEGQYMLNVKTDMGDLIHREVVQVQGYDNKRLLVKLRSPNPQRPPSGVISLQQLAHKPPKEAQKAFLKSLKLLGKGDTAGSLEWLRKAVDLDPDYMQAINNLGVRYLVAKRMDEAIAQFRRAIELDHYAPASYSNLAHALVIKGDPVNAEAAARRAVELDPQDPKPSYLLGLTLVMQDKFTSEAVSSLRRSEHISPRARLTLGLALARTGSVADARETLTSCLASSDAPVKAEAERLLAQIR